VVYVRGEEEVCVVADSLKGDPGGFLIGRVTQIEAADGASTKGATTKGGLKGGPGEFLVDSGAPDGLNTKAGLKGDPGEFRLAGMGPQEIAGIDTAGGLGARATLVREQDEFTSLEGEIPAGGYATDTVGGRGEIPAGRYSTNTVGGRGEILAGGYTTDIRGGRGVVPGEGYNTDTVGGRDAIPAGRYSLDTEGRAGRQVSVVCVVGLAHANGVLARCAERGLGVIGLPEPDYRPTIADPDEV